MKPDQIRKLLGGYATGTLTEDERQALFAAALDDQRLFDAIADEEALRALLADPSYRRELAVALADEPSLAGKLAAWWRRPLPIALAGAVALMTVAILTLLPHPDASSQVAMSRSVASQAAHEAEAKTSAAETPAVPAGEADEAALSDKTRQEPARRQAEAPVPSEAGGVPSQAAGGQGTGGGGSRRPGTNGPESDAATMQELSQAPSAGLPEQAAPPPAPAAVGGQAPQPATAMERAVTGVKLSPGPRQQASGSAGARPAPAPAAEPPARAKEERRARPAMTGEVRESSAGARSQPLGFGMLRSPAPPETSLAVTLERRAENGSFLRIPAGVAIARNDVVRLRVTTPASGYVYVIDRTAPEGNRLIFTGEATGEGAILAPRTGGLTPPAEAGQRRLSVLFSREPLELETLESAAPARESRVEAVAEVVLEYL